MANYAIYFNNININSIMALNDNNYQFERVLMKEMNMRRPIGGT